MFYKILSHNVLTDVVWKGICDQISLGNPRLTEIKLIITYTVSLC